ncbi:ShlB/FhaC/HecB family hemolysin secretion/activation protein [Acidocella sp.]|uniref:ShlB/FhaC/HecB family hemolysin secretion/activation protein n=1 Tax=Acidocella sp. TaxID=50710 RepID=UPI0026027264|nr:POTRA domain-containing protein [Acidocella sp.]
MTSARIKPSLKAALALASLLTPACALASPPPSQGAILQQKALPPSLPTVPGPAITIAPQPQQNLPANVTVQVAKVTITGNSLIATATLETLLAPIIGRTVPLSQLDAAVARITDAYHQAGYPLAYAYLPPQRIAGGGVRVVVVEPRYDQILVEGHSRLRAAMVRHTAGLTPGAPVAEAPLDRGMLLLNQTPGVHVAGVLVPGASPGTTSLRLTPTDAPLLSGSVTQTDYGSHDTGSYLTSAVVNANDPFGYGSALSADGLLSDTGVFRAGGFTATSPDIWDGVRLGVYGSATNYKLGDGFKALDQFGRASQLGADLTAPLLLTPSQVLTLRFDVLNNWLATSTRSVQATSQTDIPMERLSLSGACADRLGGVTSAALSVAYGRLELSSGAAKAADAAGPKAEGGFWLSQLQLQRQQELPMGFSLLATFSGQLASKNLDSSQQFYLGGPYGVMSYAVGAGGGDEGYLLTAKLVHPLLVPHLPGSLSAALLAQSGEVWVNHTPYAGAGRGNIVNENGAGVELDYSLANWTLSAAFATQLGANSSPLISSRRNQGWFSLSYDF